MKDKIQYLIQIVLSHIFTQTLLHYVYKVHYLKRLYSHFDPEILANMELACSFYPLRRASNWRFERGGEGRGGEGRGAEGSGGERRGAGRGGEGWGGGPACEFSKITLH